MIAQIGRRELIELGAALAGTGVAGMAGAQETTTSGGENGTLFVAALTGGNQNPPVETSATGLAMFALAGDGVDYSLGVANVQNVVMAHAHLGGPDENGPVVVWLAPSVAAREPELLEGESNGIIARGTFTGGDLVGPLESEPFSDLLSAMRAGDAYVNVQTRQNQRGEIRGQIRPVESLL